MTTITLDTHDVGIVIRATITFVAFDPTGAACYLGFTNLGGRTELRPMTFDGVSVATYTTQAGDFATGYYTAFVRAIKGGVQIDSELFQIAVI